MIGDWVKLSKGNWSENRQVGLIDIEMIAESVYLAEPIPLTAEILEKNGWRSRMNGTGEFYLKKPLVDAAVVTKTITGFQMNHGAFSGLSIHYVH